MGLRGTWKGLILDLRKCREPEFFAYKKCCCVEAETETGQDLLYAQRCVILHSVQFHIEKEDYMALS